MLTRRRFVVVGAASIGAAGILGGCAGKGADGPVIGDIKLTTPLTDDIAAGRASHPHILKTHGGEYKNARLTAYIDGIGRKIAAETENPTLPYTFTVLNSAEFNAFATGGGYIYVTRGLIAGLNTEADIAGILAHEAGHTNARHGAKRAIATRRVGLDRYRTDPTKIKDPAAKPAVLTLMQWRRDNEREADMLGFRYMTKAGYDRQGMISAAVAMRDYDGLNLTMVGSDADVDDFKDMDDHPRSLERVISAAREAEFVRLKIPQLGREAYLNHVEGMLFGDDPSRGVMVGTTFIHPVHGFAFTMPKGFAPRGVNDAGVRGVHHLGAAVDFTIRPLQYGMKPADLLRTELAPAGRLATLDKITAGGLDGAVGVYTTGTDTEAREVRVAAFRGTPDLAFCFELSAPLQAVADFRDRLAAVPKSIRPLTPTDRAQVKYRHVKVVRVESGNTIAGLSANFGYGPFNQDWFRFINALEPGESLQVGGDVKTVALTGVA